MASTKVIQYNPYNPSNIALTKEILVGIFKNVNIDFTNDLINKPLDLETFQISLTHKSYAMKSSSDLDSNYILVENKDNCVPLQKEDNERIEMLGDRVFDLVVVWYLYTRFPGQGEGFMTTLKTKIVSGEFMSKYAHSLGIEKYILMSKNLEYKEGRMTESILEDAFEAFIGATFLQFGYEFCRKMIKFILEENLDFAELIRHDKNYIDILVKYCQMMKLKKPDFIDESIHGHSSNRLFTIVVKDGSGKVIGKGTEKTKKKAEQIAAHNALIQLGVIN
jgi:ribonuclease-3